MFFFIMDRSKIKKISFACAAVLLIGIFCGYAYKKSIDRNIRTNAQADAGNVETVVIDPGHGGMDSGAVGVSGSLEKDINLDVAIKLDSLMGLFGIKTVMTREKDISLDYEDGRTIRDNKMADLNARVDIVKQTANPVLISIHTNNFTEEKYSGAQTFYAPTEKSDKIAEMIQETLVEGLDKSNNRKAKAAPDKIYIIKKADFPAVIVECGFVSNAREEALLKDARYRTRIAVSVLSGYLEYKNSFE